MTFDSKIGHGKILNELIVLEHSFFEDHRGKIWTSYMSNYAKTLGHLPIFRHDKFAVSKKGTLRGIHYDNSMSKLVACVSGEIQQVVVDMRPESANYKQWESFALNSDKPMSILIPPMFGNAFLVKSQEAVYHYKVSYKDKYMDAADQFTAKCNDPEINIKWDCTPSLISQRDN